MRSKAEGRLIMAGKLELDWNYKTHDTGSLDWTGSWKGAPFLIFSHFERILLPVSMSLCDEVEEREASRRLKTEAQCNNSVI